MAAGVLPPWIMAVLIDVLNYAMFAGGLLVKMPQVIAILRTRTVKGMSEASLSTEFLACLSLCAYNLLMGHPFKNWGEMALIGAQCGIQIILFWVFVTEPLAVAPRVLGVAAVMAGCLALWMGMLPPVLLPVLGLVQTVLGSVARVPQIILNFKQRHTGNQSIITWGMSLFGTCVRIITTLLSVNDFVSLLSYIIAATLNFTLFMQILVFWSRTNEIIWSKKQKQKD